MKNLLLLILFCSLCGASAACAQELPTAKQCRADRAAWGALKGEDMAKLSFTEVQQRESELSKCRFVDQPKWGDYVSLSTVFDAEEQRRMFHFIDRHGYWQQFLQEDDHGER